MAIKNNMHLEYLEKSSRKENNIDSVVNISESLGNSDESEETKNKKNESEDSGVTEESSA
jgi:hypothetical protein